MINPNVQVSTIQLCNNKKATVGKSLTLSLYILKNHDNHRGKSDNLLECMEKSNTEWILISVQFPYQSFL